jgi:hypothetical protein
MKGKYFEELKIGAAFVTRSRTITETDVGFYGQIARAVLRKRLPGDPLGVGCKIGKSLGRSHR